MASPPSSPPRVVEFDGLHGCAISLVLWHHLAEPFLPPGRTTWLGWLQAGTNLSWCGVDLFFVLSDFFIGGILIDQRASPRLARVFYLRRALRILPLYYLTLALILVCAELGLVRSGHLFPAWAYALGVSNFFQSAQIAWDWPALGVLWSIAVEEQFYLAAPWVVRALSPAWFPWFMLALVGAAQALRTACLFILPGNNIAIHVLMPMRMDALALGALVAWARRTADFGSFWSRLERCWAPWLAVGLVLIAGLAVLRPDQGSAVLAVGGYTLLAAAFALLVAVLAGPRPAWLCRLLAWSPLVLLGRHSYFIYLWHFFLGYAVLRALGGWKFELNSPRALLIVLAAVGATWLAAALSWRYFESPLIRRGHRHSY